MLKIKQIASKCKRTGTLLLCDHEESGQVIQWVSDGYSYYPLNNIPYLKMDNLITLLEITEKQLEKIETEHISVKDISGISFDDFEEGERVVTPESIKVQFNGVSYGIFRTTEGVVYIDSSAVLPLSNMINMIEFYERKDRKSGKSYIVCKTGMLIQAVILAENIISPKLVDELYKIAEITKAEVNR